MNLNPNAVQPTLTTLDGGPPAAADQAGGGAAASAARCLPTRRRPAARGGGGGRGGAAAAADPSTRPRVILRFPTDPNDMLLSGGLVGQRR